MCVVRNMNADRIRDICTRDLGIDSKNTQFGNPTFHFAEFSTNDIVLFINSLYFFFSNILILRRGKWNSLCTKHAIMTMQNDIHPDILVLWSRNHWLPDMQAFFKSAPIPQGNGDHRLLFLDTSYLSSLPLSKGLDHRQTALIQRHLHSTFFHWKQENLLKLKVRQDILEYNYLRNWCERDFPPLLQNLVDPLQSSRRR